jgi:regulator of protease activity HflC (stomatin/prohibitin superfamily)
MPSWLVNTVLAIGALTIVVAPIAIYTSCRIDVPGMHVAVLTRRTGIDLKNHEEVALDENHKGLQKKVLAEGRYFKNPVVWGWEIYPMIEIPEGMMGVRVRLYGDDLPYGHFVALSENQKGIVREVLRPGRHALNAVIKGQENTRISDYLEVIELHEPITISAGYKGVVTNLAGEIPENSNTLLVETDKRGVQPDTLDPGTYYMNPYMYRIEAIDCRSQRFNLADGDDMGFPSKDGFWVSLDGIIEFRVKPESAAEVYVTYNEVDNDEGIARDIGTEIIRKVIMPNARSFCRLEGSKSSGRDFISGDTRIEFQQAFQTAIRTTCEEQGIEVVQALITRINPPQAIAEPVRSREVANQQLLQYTQEILQQGQEAKLATAKATVLQRQKLVEAKREVIVLTTAALKNQDIALAGANRDKEVAELELEASKDRADAILAGKRAEAEEIKFKNIAEAAGWKRAIEALDGDGNAYARFVLYQKLAPGYRSIMTNTADSPLMRIFENFDRSAGDASTANTSSTEQAGN